MNDVCFCFCDDTAAIFREELLYRHCESIHHVFPVVNLDQVLFEPVVPDKLALAVVLLNTWKAVRFTTVELLDVCSIIVAEEFAKGRLLMEPGLLPLRAIGIAHIIWTFVPRLQDLHCVLRVLYNHEASVCQRAIESIRIVLWLFRVPWVFSHGDGVLGRDIPVVEHPLDWYMEEAERGVSVKEDNKFVVLDVVCQGRGLDPGGVSVFKVCRVDELVVIAVDLRIRVVVENPT